MARFRYSLNNGVSWTTITADLPYSIPSTASQDVLVEPLGASVLNEKPPVVVPKPVNTTAPALSGTPKVGQELSLTNGVWSNNPDSYAYRYKADGVVIAGATTSKYTPGSGDVGKNIVGEVLATNAGGTTVAASNSLGPVAAQDPFIVTNDVYWWDMDFAGNVLDTDGHTTVAIVRERLRGEVEPWQPIKARQPNKVTGGIDCNQGTNRGLIIDLPKITNGKNGWYIAGVFKPLSTNGQIMSITKAGGSQLSRMDLLFNGSRLLGFRGNSTDNSTVAYVATTTALTIGTEYGFGILWDFDNDTAKIWLGGVEQTLSAGPTGGPWNNFPASDPQSVTIGNNVAGNLSFNGTIKQLIFKDGVPSNEQRASIDAYNLSRVA